MSDIAHGQLDSGRRRFRANVTANVGYLVLSAGIGLWFTPYLIQHLGVAAYGLVPLALSLASYMSVVTIALSGSVGRFLTIDLERQDLGSANRTFNTALFGSLGLVGALLVPAIALLLAAPLVLHVPAGMEGGTRALLASAMAAFFLTVVASSFGVSTFVTKRFDLRSALNGMGLLARIGIVVILFRWLSPQLWQVGLGVVGAALLYLEGSVWVWGRLTPQLRIRAIDFDRTRLREMVSMGAWMVINQVGVILFLSVDLLVVNMVVGAEAAGCYAPVLQWSMLLRAMAIAVAGVLVPTIIGLHARGHMEGLTRTTQRAVKLLGLAMALPVGLLCGLARPLLETWLGDSFAQLAPLMWLLVGPLCINLSVLPLFSVNMALNKVRWPGIVTVVMGVGNLALAITLAGPLGWGMYGVAAAGAIMLTLQNVAYTPLYSAAILRRSLNVFLGPMLPPLIAAALVGSTAAIISSNIDLGSWPRLVCAGSVIAIPYLFVVFFLGLREGERKAVLELIFHRGLASL